MALHILEGTFRPHRHGTRPATVGNLAVAVRADPEWQPDVRELGAPGQALVRELVTTYAFGVGERPLVLEVGHVADRLASLRATLPLLQEDDLRRAMQLEIAGSRLLAALLAQLQLPKGE